MKVTTTPSNTGVFTLLSQEENSYEYLQIKEDSYIWIHQIKLECDFNNLLSYGTALIISQLNFERILQPVCCLDPYRYYFYYQNNLFFLEFDNDNRLLFVNSFKDFPLMESWMVEPFLREHYWDCMS